MSITVYFGRIAINEPDQLVDERCVRAFKVPFEVTDSGLEIASIADSALLELTAQRFRDLQRSSC